MTDESISLRSINFCTAKAGGLFTPAALGKLGYADAMPYLEEALRENNIGYFDYTAIKNAVEELGGEVTIDRDFSGDSDFESLKKTGGMMQEITFEDVKNDENIRVLVEQANHCLEMIGYTDHGPRHVGYVSRIAGEILEKLNMPKRRVELAKIAGWVHDIGNMINRKHHGLNGAVMLFPILCDLGISVTEASEICSAVGSHEEETGSPVSDISAATHYS